VFKLLSIAERIVDNLGGTVTVQNDASSGATSLRCNRPTSLN
jgi:C4-dicarboxylate-specific signal transduction histidine kinase